MCFFSFFNSTINSKQQQLLKLLATNMAQGKMDSAVTF